MQRREMDYAPIMGEKEIASGGKASERRELPPIAARVPAVTGAGAALFSGEGSGKKSGLTVSTRSERNLTQPARPGSDRVRNRLRCSLDRGRASPERVTRDQVRGIWNAGFLGPLAVDGDYC
jgi:hypothetical protein